MICISSGRYFLIWWIGAISWVFFTHCRGHQIPFPLLSSLFQHNPLRHSWPQKVPASPVLLDCTGDIDGVLVDNPMKAEVSMQTSRPDFRFDSHMRVPASLRRLCGRKLEASACMHLRWDALPWFVMWNAVSIFFLPSHPIGIHPCTLTYLTVHAQFHPPRPNHPMNSGQISLGRVLWTSGVKRRAWHRHGAHRVLHGGKISQLCWQAKADRRDQRRALLARNTCVYCCDLSHRMHFSITWYACDRFAMVLFAPLMFLLCSPLAVLH